MYGKIGFNSFNCFFFVCRDLKPENILLNENMHILISDFGSAFIDNKRNLSEPKLGEELNKRKSSFVGTAQFVSPEMLTTQKVTTLSDLWSFGCLIYQMLSGLFPFQSSTEYLIFQKILQLNYEFPSGFDSNAKALIENLLQLKPEDRLGSRDRLKCNQYSSIRVHAFFNPLKDRWDNLHEERPPTISKNIRKKFEIEHSDQTTVEDEFEIKVADKEIVEEPPLLEMNNEKSAELLKPRKCNICLIV